MTSNEFDNAATPPKPTQPVDLARMKRMAIELASMSSWMSDLVEAIEWHRYELAAQEAEAQFPRGLPATAERNAEGQGLNE